MARFSIAALFWSAAQNKVTDFSAYFLTGEFKFGWPHLLDSAVALFQDEYKLPLLTPAIAALIAATAEHVFSVLLLTGLGMRFAALGLLVMTFVIQLFVYPGAYPTHGAWAAILLTLVTQRPGAFSIDHGLPHRHRRAM